ncbi:divalent-cation tolerance protein CutA [Stakelama marina]|uniref:Divalent-cation tolerance protein CutA n=1 Tax=Stakelama marina TaxID=2826939 RepID=A0A8T4IGS9_9SPHN|nr:divalent-cation tolerance protein CutA [Stakelama marina]MBR0553823.1 divalent-cation tolerance protein CutA [Stakelama marina]
MSDIALLHTTFPDRESAGTVAAAVVDARLAACANILSPCVSVYRWQGAIANDPEVPVLFKTTIPIAKTLRDRITELHPYDVPVIELWPVAVAQAVFDWAERETDA